MDLKLNQKNVLVTGSSKGIGFGIAQAYLNEGANVMINSRGNIDLSMFKAASRNQISSVSADVSTIDGINLISQKVLDVFKGKLDVLVCNVGSGKSVPVGTETFEDWKKSFDTNFFSTTNTIEALKNLVTKESGSILCISSICGLEALGAPLTYSAAKAALNSYVVGLSRFLAREGIRINAIAPGNVLFEGSTWEQKLKNNKKGVLEMLEKEVPLKKFGDVEDISNMALFLSSDKAKFITGSIIVIDGGQVRSW